MEKNLKYLLYLFYNLLAFLLLAMGTREALAENKFSGSSFRDIQNHWASKEINYLAAQGLIAGKGEGRFCPEAAITRSEFIKIIAGVLGVEPSFPKEPTFQDVAPEKWYYPYVEGAAGKGLIQGNGGRFRPEEAITREEGAVILVRAMGLENKARQLVRGQIHVLLLSFPDREEVSPWADEYLALAVREHLFAGEPGRALAPVRPLTRAEGAVLAIRLMVWLKAHS